MTNQETKRLCRLAIAPVSRGIGFAMLEGTDTLLDWGVKTAKGDKNAQSLDKVQSLIKRYEPVVIVVQDLAAEGVRRAPRICELNNEIITLARKLNIKVKLITPNRMQRFFFGEVQGTKQERAEILAKRFPEELASRLPPKRKPWNSEDYRMDFFDAVALGVAAQ